MEVIPNGLDTEQYKPIEKTVAREILNLPQDKCLVLFGAVGATRDPRKGYPHLQNALARLSETELENKTELIVFGSSGSTSPSAFEFPTHYVGRVSDDPTLVLLYNAADVFVLPSEHDNLPNTVIEALACGVPCVGFDIGGVPDMIEHGTNGYLAEPFDDHDLADGIRWVLEDEERRSQLGQNARAKAIREYALEVSARRYMDLYEDILGASGDGAS